MRFLPIADRELRLAARKRTTFWLRTIAGLVGLIIGAACLLIMSLGGFGPSGFGKALFGILTWLSFFAVFASGLFFTSDTLSEEKREGTLGLLFLTDLRGYDVVSGKLLATSLRGSYAFIAVFPILAMTLVMGGVTGAEFWKTSLALVNALFFSLATGLLVSAVSRDFQKALACTLLVLLLFSLGGSLADWIIANARGRGYRPMLTLSSPAYTFILAKAWGRSPYWLSLGITQAIAWSFLALTSWAIRHTWQERAKTGPAQSGTWASRFKYGGTERRTKFRRRLMERNVVLWLACRERWQSLGMWFVSLLTTTGFILIVIYWPREAWMVWGYMGGVVLLLVYLAVASQASRFLVEAGRSGLTELLLAAPLREKEIVHGNWRALTRMFGWPVAVLICLDVIGTTFALESWQGVAATTSAAISASSGTNAASTNIAIRSTAPVTSSGIPQFPTILLAIATAGLPVAANVIALCWFGMWMGHSSRNGHLAALKTILFVQVIPWMVIHFLSYLAMMVLMVPLFSRSASGPATWLTWWPLTSAVVTGLLALIKDIIFIKWSRNKLYFSFREQAVRNSGRINAGTARRSATSPQPEKAGGVALATPRVPLSELQKRLDTD